MQGILECLTKQKISSSPGNYPSVKAGSFIIAFIYQTGNGTRKRNFHVPIFDKKEPEESLAQHVLRTSAILPKLLITSSVLTGEHTNLQLATD